LCSRAAFLRFPKIKPRISYIFITVSSDARSLDSNFTEAILWCSIVTSVVCSIKNFLNVSNFRLMHFVTVSSSLKLLNQRQKQSVAVLGQLGRTF